MFGVQTSYNTLFGITHNGGTWFVSCLLLGYILYPVFKSIVSSKKRWPAVFMLLTGHFLLIYSNILIANFSLESLYSNPIARAAEFMIGVAFAEILFREKAPAGEPASAATDATTNTLKQEKATPTWSVLLIIAITACVSGTIWLFSGAGLKEFVFLYMGIPAILIVLLIASKLRCGFLEKSRVLSALSGMSYQFFLMQLFLWKLTDLVLGLIGIQGNAAKIAVSFTICLAGSFLVWRFYDKPIRKKLLSKSPKSHA